MKKVRWVVQNNLIAENDRNQMKTACEELGVLYEGTHVVPFSYGLSKFTIDEHINIYYGSTTFIGNIMLTDLDKTGIFSDDENFLMSNYLEKWGDHMLSSEARVLPYGNFITENHNVKDQFFVRPNGDSKLFDGEVREFGDIKKGIPSMNQLDKVSIDDDDLVLVGPAYNIRKEWRNYIVDGKVVSSSRYRENFRLSKSAVDITESMIKFVEDRAKEYAPNDVFVMDIALCGGEDEYYIIECGGMNSVGFYHADIKSIVSSVTEYILNK